MRRKELLFGMFCGAVGAILTTAVGLFTPLVAQDELSDVAFGKIICREIVMVDSDNNLCVRMDAERYGGSIYVNGKDGDSSVSIGIDKNGGDITVHGTGNKMAYMEIDDEGGRVGVFGNGGDRDNSGSASLSIGENRGRIGVFNEDGKVCALMVAYVDSYINGGLIEVFGSDGKLRAVMGAGVHAGVLAAYGSDGTTVIK